jgi:alcohol dehydrogenase/S-(hydroxymethyl)glutathione dehydrogenase/alcohol dehydrogenase
MNVVQGAALSGAATIIAADIVQAKLDWAREFGATHGVKAQGEALTRAVLELTDGVGVDHAFVCINPPETLLPAFRAATKGGNVVVTALTPDAVSEIKIPPLELLVTQKAIMGAVYGFQSPRLQIPELLSLYRKGDLKLTELITRTYRLDEINQGYADLEAGKNLRGVVVM